MSRSIPVAKTLLGPPQQGQIDWFVIWLMFKGGAIAGNDVKEMDVPGDALEIAVSRCSRISRKVASVE